MTMCWFQEEICATLKETFSFFCIKKIFFLFSLTQIYSVFERKFITENLKHKKKRFYKTFEIIVFVKTDKYRFYFFGLKKTISYCLLGK